MKNSEIKAVENAMRFGNLGDWAYNDENGRKIVRNSTGVNTLPDCLMFENEEYVGEAIVWDAVKFLIG